MASWLMTTWILVLGACVWPSRQQGDFEKGKDLFPCEKEDFGEPFDFQGPPTPIQLGGRRVNRQRAFRTYTGRASIYEHFNAWDVKEANTTPGDIKNLTHPMLRTLHLYLNTDIEANDSLVFREEGYKFVEEDRWLYLEQVCKKQLSMWDKTPIDNRYTLKEFEWDMNFSCFDDLEKPTLEKTFNLLDKTGQGELDQHEAIKFIYYLMHFRHRDLNMDGVMNRDEWVFTTTKDEDNGKRKALQKRRRQFAELDLNKDGLVDPEESFQFDARIFQAKQALDQLIDLADTNGDGMDKEELLSLRDRAAKGEVKWWGTHSYRTVKKWILNQQLDKMGWHLDEERGIKRPEF